IGIQISGFSRGLCFRLFTNNYVRDSRKKLNVIRPCIRGQALYLQKHKIAYRRNGVSERRGTNSMEYGVSSKEKK
ncbi:hypothetical protein KAU34_08690, partial [candidate division WOR-3 bacterium]|nr:hypothetical protein [candidate division WOR-3 bacterium]